jgi:hypothetical protein
MPKNLHSSKPKPSRTRYTKTERWKVNKERKTAYSLKHGHHRPRKRYGTDFNEPQIRDDVKLYTFDDEYKTYRRTRGRRGLSPNPDKRPAENPMCRLRNDILTGTTRFFPIGECMENPIGKINVEIL